jgi:hypothetical protein
MSLFDVVAQLGEPRLRPIVIQLAVRRFDGLVKSRQNLLWI